MTVAQRAARRPSLWKGVHEALVTEINAGRYPAGSKLPTEAELSKRFGVNRHTVRRALEAMTEEGRIHVRRGSGSWVTQGRFDYPIGARTRFSQNLLASGHMPERELLRIETIAAERREAEVLEIEPGDPIVVQENISLSDGVPIIYARTSFPDARLPGLADALQQDPSVTSALKACGVADYSRHWTRLIAERPGALIARHLKMPELHPVIRSEYVNVDTRGSPVEYTLCWFCSDRVQLFVESATFNDDRGPR